MLYIIRHGQTEKNKANLLQGRSDIALNDTGRLQAVEVRDRLLAAGIHFDRVYSSPLVRAVQTAEIVTGMAPHVIEPRLIEMDYGPYEGMDLKNPAPELMEFFRDLVHHPARGAECPAFHPCHCHEGGAGIPDAGFPWKLVVEIYRQLCRVFGQGAGGWKIWNSGRIHRMILISHFHHFCIVR